MMPSPADSKPSKNFPAHFLQQPYSQLHNLIWLKAALDEKQSQFVSQLILYLPEVASQVDEGDLGILHLEVGKLELATRNAINSRDWRTVAKHFVFVEDVIKNAGPELYDSLCISYLGNLFYGETSINYARARNLLSRSLNKALEQIERHYEDLTA